MGIWNLIQPEYGHRVDVERMRRRFEAERDRARRSRGRDRDRIEALEDEVGRLALFVATIYGLLGEKGVITKDEFAEAARAIDARDGEADGKATVRPDAP